MATKFDETLSHEKIMMAIHSGFKSDSEIQEIIRKHNLKAEKYLEETKNLFSSSAAQLRKQFTI